jgi:hypothetical protein
MVRGEFHSDDEAHPMRRIIGLMIMTASIVIAIAMIVLADMTISTTPTRTAPDQFVWYEFKLNPDWKCFAADGFVFLVGLLLLIPRKSTPN